MYTYVVCIYCKVVLVFDQCNVSAGGFFSYTIKQVSNK